ncbi:MAG: chemotaxis protein CheW [Thermodesulfobacteriota bacterium]|nr:chemotaxis protein CheW [Thermodesulfobacteriota bacterium]
MRGQKTPSDENRKTAIDWSEIHRRLEAVRAKIKQGWAPTYVEKKKLLKARAKALARVPAKEKTDEVYLQVIEFSLAYERYAVESAWVREVYPLKEFTPLPCTPPFVLGIVNVRGQILSVIDIRKFFDMPEKDPGYLNKIIILHAGEKELGIIVDSIAGVRSIPSSHIQPSLPTLTGIRAEYLKGVTEERLAVLNVERILSSEKTVVHEEVLA